MGLAPGFVPATFSRGTSRAPLARDECLQWSAATILKLTSGSENNDRNSAAAVRLRRRPQNVAASRDPRCRSQNAQLHAMSGWRHTKMIAHRHFNKGRHVKQLVWCCRTPAWLISPGCTEECKGECRQRVADLVDDQGQFAVGAIAEIGRQRMKCNRTAAGSTAAHPSPVRFDPRAAAWRAHRRAAMIHRAAMIGFAKAVERQWYSRDGL